MASKQKKISAANPPLDVIQEIGSGAMGDVILCHDPYLDRPVAVKRMQVNLLESQDAILRFSREVQILSQMRHPNIAQVFAYWESEGVRYLAMEFINGWSLKQILDAHKEGKQRKPFPEWAVLAILWDIVSALAYAHADYAHKSLGRITHRDIKPANIMVGFNGRVTLLDFGISKPRHIETSMYNTMDLNASMGTIAYMSPEQVSPHAVSRGEYQVNDITPASDIFSLGIILWEMLTGKHPVIGPNPIATASNIMQKQFEERELKGVDPLLKSVLLRMLERAPAKRPTAEELKSLLSPLYQKYPRDLSPYLGNFVHFVRKPDSVLPPPTPKSEVRVKTPVKPIAIAAAIALIVGFIVGKL